MASSGSHGSISITASRAGGRAFAFSYAYGAWRFTQALGRLS